MIQSFPKRSKRRGVTLLELLIVATIMLSVAAVSIPSIKPMMESKLASSAAASVSTYLDRAKFRAMSTGRPCGVTFEYYEGTYDGGTGIASGSASLVLRQVETPPYYSGLEEGASVSVGAGNDCIIDGELLRPIDVSNDTYWSHFVADEDSPRIQFGSVGPYFPIINGSYIKNVSGIDFPSRNNTPFRVIRDPRPTMTSPIGLPQGAVIDLEFSGTDSNLFEKGRDITVMFAPNGAVDCIYYGKQQAIPSDTIYFLVGRWDRIAALGTKTSGEEIITAAEDGLWNYEDGTNYWITINPTTGVVSTAPVNSPVNYVLEDYQEIGSVTDAVRESREFARASKRNLGGR